MKKKAQIVHEKKAKRIIVSAPKPRDAGAFGLILRAGAGAGSHKGKATRGSGIKGKGKAQRLAKHRKPW
jgi:hypothetical protein